MAVTGRARAGVRRLFVRDPYNKNSTATVARFSKVADQFTDNPNVLYDPSKAPGSVKEVSVASSRKSVQKPGKASRGRMKVIKRTLFNQNAGKTLKRRTF
jgi:hypothetical protein